MELILKWSLYILEVLIDFILAHLLLVMHSFIILFSISYVLNLLVQRFKLIEGHYFFFICLELLSQFLYFFLEILVALNQQRVSFLQLLANLFEYFSSLMLWLALYHIFCETSSRELQLNLKALNALLWRKMIPSNELFFDFLVAFYLLGTNFEDVEAWYLDVRVWV